MTIGERIKQARKASKLSLRALADQVQVSAMAISKYERDKDVPGSGVLLQLAQALGVPVDFFFRQAPPEIRLQTYRKHASLGIKEQGAVEARIQAWLERYLEIEGFFMPDEISVGLPHYPIKSLPEVETAAEALRSAWDLGHDPIENFTLLLEDRGIKVGQVDGYVDFDACTFLAGNSPVIVTKANLPGDRQRFNLGHELGHLVLDIAEGLDIERTCHRFVGAFLAPAAAARRELGEHRTRIAIQELHLLKHKYGLSMQAWIFRARDLEIISPAVFDGLMRQFRKNNWHRSEPGDAYPSEKPVRMEQLIYQAVAEDLISRSRAQELLGRPLQQDWMVGAPQHEDALASAGD